MVADLEVLAICGSHRRKENSNTAYMMRKVLEGMGFKDPEIKDRIIYLSDEHINIAYCEGHDKCLEDGDCYEEPHKCTISDSMDTIYEKMRKADAFIFGSPAYDGNVSGRFKTFTDRLVPFWHSRELKEKKAVLVASAQFGPSAAACILAMNRLCEDHDIYVVESATATEKNLKTDYKEAEMKALGAALVTEITK